MRLLVDIGNTRCKWALARDTTLVETGVVSRADAEDWTAALPQCPVESIHVSSVAQPEALSRLRAFAAELGVDLSAAESKARFAGLTNAYREPERLGVDRWMACIAAQADAGGSVLVADAGTALTLDFVDANGAHQGGLITPGVATMRGALRRQTQLRPTVEHAAPVWLACDTDSAIAAGTLRSAISLLDSAALELAPDRLVLTGGGAPELARHLARPWALRPHLVLEGLAIHARHLLPTG
ncbi:type III pantothenate kinase [Salinisphaera sp.]|uniref:type III pantothenate kinase n=1 Tax=Salinisphaera sp. TaxID=1914330 RepID=UPI000C66920C|nr:type III pantothenate kinase [Salinisphaera sp.]MBS63777.1 type III pantothenate kinase [Salinisphaera sp.]